MWRNKGVEALNSGNEEKKTHTLKCKHHVIRAMCNIFLLRDAFVETIFHPYSWVAFIFAVTISRSVCYDSEMAGFRTYLEMLFKLGEMSRSGCSHVWLKLIKNSSVTAAAKCIISKFALAPPRIVELMIQLAGQRFAKFNAFVILKKYLFRQLFSLRIRSA